MNREKAASLIDHTILKAVATKEDIKQLCLEADENKFASVCVNPSYVKLAAELLKNSTTKVCTVIGFPLGANDSRTKAFETKLAVEDGATEVDMVVNVGAIKSEDWALVKADVIAVVTAAKAANSETITKVIIETCYLTDAEKEKVCEILLETGADFAKTSTGFGTGGATVADVALMKRIVTDHMLIKASGGVKNYHDLLQMVDAGANRIGTSGGIAIINDESNTASY